MRIYVHIIIYPVGRVYQYDQHESSSSFPIPALPLRSSSCFAIPIGIYTISPLFISVTVNEPLPATTGVPVGKPLSGIFMGIHDGFHNADGNVKVVSLTDGSKILRLENFKSTNGPNVHVYLSTDTIMRPVDTIPKWIFLTGVEVTASKKARAVIALGDSITDGVRSTPNGNGRWPNVLADRLVTNPEKHLHMTVLDAGISGNRILNYGIGPCAVYCTPNTCITISSRVENTPRL